MILLRTFILFFVFISATFAEGLSGNWHGTLEGEAFSISFNANGQGVMNGDPITYQTMGNMLFVDFGGDVMTYQFAIQGKTLTVSGGDLMSPLVLKQGKAPATKTQTASAQKPAAQSNTQKQASAQELVGKWCLLKSFNAVSGGGSQTSTCFELRADGTYTYYSESSMSAYSGGMYGGTASNSSDTGSWQTQGNTLITQSSNGQRNQYPLEKRNHPKNRDPMICINGDCYVTYWQKNPW